jgi:hypothetical protein
MSHGCNAGCYPNDCECELDCDIAPDADRVIAPPPAPKPINHRARAAYWALAVVAALYMGVAALLKLAGARSLT